jgi:dCMP deaminase
MILSSIRDWVDHVPLGQRPSWTEYFMIAAFMASLRSTCGSRRVGCTIVHDKQILSTGYNGSVPGDVHCIEGGCPRFEAKKRGELGSGERLADCIAVHAEQNALIQIGMRAKGGELYTTTYPCFLCAKMIVRAGIHTVYYVEGYPSPETEALFARTGLCVKQMETDRYPHLSQVMHLLQKIPLGERPSWDTYFLSLAYMASLRSTCSINRVGSLVVLDKQVIATGYKGSVPGDIHCTNGGCPHALNPDEMCIALDAEENALLSLPRGSVNNSSVTLFTTAAPSYTSAKLAIKAGIRRIVHSEELDENVMDLFSRLGIARLKL